MDKTNTNENVWIKFQDLDGNTISIQKVHLAQRPHFLLSMMAFSQVGSGTHNDPIKVNCRGPTLKIVAEYYRTGIWIRDNRIIWSDVYGGFEEQCECLGLPFDQVADFDDDDSDEWKEDMDEEEWVAGTEEDELFSGSD